MCVALRTVAALSCASTLAAGAYDASVHTARSSTSHNAKVSARYTNSYGLPIVLFSSYVAPILVRTILLLHSLPDIEYISELSY